MTDDRPPADAEPTQEPQPAPEPPPAAQPKASELIGAALGDAAKKAGIDPSSESATGHVVWRAMGGWRGVLESVLPGLVFIVAFTVSYDPETKPVMPLSLGLSVGLAVVFTVVRLVTKSPPAAALGGLVATVGAALLALWTGRGEDGLWGFAANGIYGTAFLVSALIGWPLIGLAAGFLMGEGTAWRGDRRKRRVFFWLSIAWAGLFAARLAVQLPLYFAGNVAALGTLKLVMGLPLFAPLLAITWLAVRAVYRRAEG